MRASEVFYPIADKNFRCAPLPLVEPFEGGKNSTWWRAKNSFNIHCKISSTFRILYYEL